MLRNRIGYLLGHLVTEQILWQPVRKQINHWRTEKLHLNKMNFLGPMFNSYRKNISNLIAFNPKLISPASDWPKNTYMTNFCCIFDESFEQPDPKIIQFLAHGDSPIYLGFGSLTDAAPKDVVARIINVIEKRNLRDIVLDNLPGLNVLKLSSNILPIKYAPHDWLFPKMRVVIHHGGVGTTAAGLHAGIPALIMPFLLDQFCWGKKIHEWGVGPKNLPIKDFSEQLFDSRLSELLQNTYQLNANNIMQKLGETKDGVEITIKTIFNILEKKHSRTNYYNSTK